MWFFPTKKEVKKEFKKIRDSFKKRDSKIEEIKKEVVSKKEIELMIKEAVLDLKVQSGVMSEPKSEPNQKQSHKSFEKVIYQKARKLKPEAIKQAIRGHLNEDKRTTDILNEIVNQKGLCGKTQFYHYLSVVRNEVRSKVRTEPNRTKYN